MSFEYFAKANMPVNGKKLMDNLTAYDDVITVNYTTGDNSLKFIIHFNNKKRNEWGEDAILDIMEKQIHLEIYSATLIERTTLLKILSDSLSNIGEIVEFIEE